MINGFNFTNGMVVVIDGKGFKVTSKDFDLEIFLMDFVMNGEQIIQFYNEIGEWEEVINYQTTKELMLEAIDDFYLQDKEGIHKKNVFDSYVQSLFQAFTLYDGKFYECAPWMHLVTEEEMNEIISTARTRFKRMKEEHFI